MSHYLLPGDRVIVLKNYIQRSNFEGTFTLLYNKIYQIYSITKDLITFDLNGELIGPFNIKNVVDKISKIQYDKGNIII